MLFALGYGAIGGLAVAAFVWRLVLAARGPHSPARWAVAAAIACAAVGFEAAVPQVYTWIDARSGVPNLASLIVYSAIVTALLTQIVWTTYQITPDPAGSPAGPSISGRTVMAINVIVVGSMAALFFAAPVHDRTHATDFDDHYAKVPVVDAFLGIYLCAYTLALLRTALLCRTWLAHVREQVWLRRGLVLLAAGSLIAAGYSVGKVAAVAATWAGLSAHRLSIGIAPAFASIGAAIMLLGYLCPSAIPSGLAAAGRLVALSRLRALWSALRETMPELAGAAPRYRRSGRNLLYRRIIEIRDMLLVLQPHLDPAIGTRARELAPRWHARPESRGAAVEAARIAAALHAYRGGAVPLGTESFREPDPPSLAGEVAWLTAVATEYRRSPLVSALLSELTGTPVAAVSRKTRSRNP